jgi:hypothetical protein
MAAQPPLRSCALTWMAFASQPWFPGNEERVGQARFGCLTLTLSLSRLFPDLKPTMTRPRPRMLKRPGKPKLTRDDGLRFQFDLSAGGSNSDRETIEGRERLLE